MGTGESRTNGLLYKFYGILGITEHLLMYFIGHLREFRIDVLLSFHLFFIVFFVNSGME